MLSEQGGTNCDGPQGRGGANASSKVTHPMENLSTYWAQIHNGSNTITLIQASEQLYCRNQRSPAGSTAKNGATILACSQPDSKGMSILGAQKPRWWAWYKNLNRTALAKINSSKGACCCKVVWRGVAAEVFVPGPTRRDFPWGGLVGKGFNLTQYIWTSHSQ